MGFSQSAISDAQCRRSGTDLIVSWSSTAASGTVYQVYVNRVLTWYGTALKARIAWPVSLAYIDVGAVDDGVGKADYSSLLTSGNPYRAKLTWQGGSYLSSSIDHYLIYSATTPGGAVSFTKPVGQVPAYVQGIALDGYGLGGYSEGGWGSAASSYSFVSQPLTPGAWDFAVVPVDIAGNPDGTPATTTVTIAGPPRAPAPFADGTRLAYTLNPTTHVPTLTWLASPS